MYIIRHTRHFLGVRSLRHCYLAPRLACTFLLWFLCLPSAHALEAQRQVTSLAPSVASQMATSRETQEADELTAQASQLRDKWVEASLRSAIEKYTQAVRLWRRAGDAAHATGALADAAGVHFVLGEYRQALALYIKVAAEARLIGDERREAEALCQAGRLYSYLGDNDEAVKYSNRGLAYYSRAEVEQTPQFKRSHAEALNQTGEVYFSKGYLIKAAEHFARALKLFVETGDARGEARARLFSGYMAATIGEQEKAASQYNKALELCRATGDRSGEALSLTALGLDLSFNHKEEDAARLHRAAMAIFRDIGDHQSQAITLNGLGQAYQNLGEYDLALENDQQALKLFLDNGSLDFASATIYQIASVYRAKGDIAQALEYYERCASLSRASKAVRTEAYAMNEVATLYASQGKKDRTLDQYQKLLKLYAAVNDTRGQVLTLNNMGDFFLSLGDTARALAQYHLALPLSQRAGERSVELTTLYNLARAAHAAGDTGEAISRVKESIAIAESMRANISSPDFRSSYFSGVRQNYELYVELLMEMERQQPGQGYAAAALGVSENARARSLLELLAEVGTDIRQGADPILLERLREVRQLLKAQYQSELSSGGRSTAETAEVESELDRLRAEYQALQAEIRQHNSREATLGQPRNLTLGEIQAELSDGDTLLLEYMLGDKKSYLWAVTRDSLNSYELPPRAALEKDASDLYKSLVARQEAASQQGTDFQSRLEQADRDYNEQSRNLSRKLLGPVAAQLGNKRLLIVTEGLLQYIPFDALPEPAVGTDQAGGSAETSLLVSRHEVISQPSISTLAGIRREPPRTRSAGDLVAILADPVFDLHDALQRGEQALRAGETTPEVKDGGLALRALKDFESIKGGGFPRLAHASEEADAILSTIPDGAGMAAKGFDASRETAVGNRVGHARIVHFATHGLVNSEHPEFSGIVLSMVNREGRSEDGFLDLQDIYSLNLSADLVVLSACETGLGKDVKGEGFIGLTRGFMYAGSKSVVASLWKVDDHATAALMSRFYRAMFEEGLPPAAALKTAKEYVQQQPQWRAPFFWAAFVLQGEYDERIEVQRRAWPVTATAIVLSLILIAVGSAIFMRRWQMSRLR